MSSDDASDAEGPDREGAGEVDLRLNHLNSFKELKEEVEMDGCYNRNGACPRRIKRVLKTPKCPCQCSLPFRVLLAVCEAFWNLRKSAQDAILWNLQCGGRKHTWSIEGLHRWKGGSINLPGYHVCRESWARFMGIGKQRVRRTKRRFRGVDERSLRTCAY